MNFYNIALTFQQAKARNWDTIYVAIDVHKTILTGDYKNESFTFYPGACECLQYLSSRSDLVLILYTCSYPMEVEKYQAFFQAQGIIFKYVNKNPEAKDTDYGTFQEKLYFNILLEDKAGFEPQDWPAVEQCFRQYETY
jgi:hypothetical protein